MSNVKIFDLMGHKLENSLQMMSPMRLPVAQWVKLLLIGHSACWAEGLRALAVMASNPGLEGGFSARSG